MANDHYSRGYDPQPTQRVGSTDLKNEFQAVEAGFDSVQTDVKRTLRQDGGSEVAAMPNAISRALKVLSFDASGNPRTTIAETDLTAAVSAAAAAATSATNSANSASASASSASAAATSATNAASSATAAAASATAATTNGAAQVALATTQANNAASSAGSAAASAASAADSATAATTNGAVQVALATTQANNASTSATNAANSASAAATSATNAANSATAAATSATNASNSASAAATSAANISLTEKLNLGSKTSDPTVDNQGQPLLTGALYFNSVANETRVYTGSMWKAAGSAVNGTANRYDCTATAGQTTFTATYDVGFVDVYLNGLKLAPADFTATTGTNVVLATGATAGDVVSIVGYGAFEVANTYTQAQTDALLAGKQDTLVSGTNIKTVNGAPLTGSGDLQIKGAPDYLLMSQGVI